MQLHRPTGSSGPSETEYSTRWCCHGGLPTAIPRLARRIQLVEMLYRREMLDQREMPRRRGRSTTHWTRTLELLAKLRGLKVKDRSRAAIVFSTVHKVKAGCEDMWDTPPCSCSIAQGRFSCSQGMEFDNVAMTDDFVDITSIRKVGERFTTVAPERNSNEVEPDAVRVSGCPVIARKV